MAENNKNLWWKIIAPIIVVALLQLGAIAWYFGGLNSRVIRIEEWVSLNRNTQQRGFEAQRWIERHRKTIEDMIPRIDERLIELTQAIRRIEIKIEAQRNTKQEKPPGGNK